MLAAKEKLAPKFSDRNNYQSCQTGTPTHSRLDFSIISHILELVEVENLNAMATPD